MSIHSDMDESHEHSVEQKKPGTKKRTLHFYLYVSPRQRNLSVCSVRSKGVVTSGARLVVTKRGYGRGSGNSYILCLDST